MSLLRRYWKTSNHPASSSWGHSGPLYFTTNNCYLTVNLQCHSERWSRADTWHAVFWWGLQLLEHRIPASASQVCVVWSPVIHTVTTRVLPIRRHVMPSSQRWQDKTRQWYEENRRQVKTVFSSPHCIARLDKTVLKFSVTDSLDLSPILFTPPT